MLPWDILTSVEALAKAQTKAKNTLAAKALLDFAAETVTASLAAPDRHPESMTRDSRLDRLTSVAALRSANGDIVGAVSLFDLALTQAEQSTDSHFRAYAMQRIAYALAHAEPPDIPSDWDTGY